MGAEEGIWVRGSGYYLMWWGRGGGRVLGAAGPRLLLNVFGVCMHLQAQDGDRDVQRLITPSMQPGPELILLSSSKYLEHMVRGWCIHIHSLINFIQPCYIYIPYTTIPYTVYHVPYIVYRIP